MKKEKKINSDKSYFFAKENHVTKSRTYENK